ncbi:DUF5719 family protein [Kitasatospora sp. NPDC051853]|uniref:DUF5719 family protein n=1 Tax=Kitasatospora sp. NPDC051853 TaxID=3364058 RepID=UPI00378837CA
MKKPTLKAPTLKAPKFGRSAPGADEPAAPGAPRPSGPTASGASRTGVSLLAGAVAIGVVFGVAELRPPADPEASAPAAATSAKVERTALVCPQPLHGLTGSTALTLFSPQDGGTGGYGALSDVLPRTSADVPSAAPAAAPSAAASGAPAPGASPAPAPADAAPADARVVLAKPGVPVTGPAANADTAPGTTAVATGGYAPGFTISQTTTVTDEQGRGLSGFNCTPTGTSFWFSGASTAGDRVDYVSLVNPDPLVPAVVDLKLFGEKGPIDNPAAEGIALGPGASQAIRLPSLTKDQKDLAVHVVARSGRIGAGVHAADGTKGSDWIPPSAAPAATQVLPGLAADTSAARLVVAAPGEEDADLKIQVSGRNGWFTPAGFETIHVKAGMVSAVDLGQVTRGEPGALRLSPSDETHPTPVVATLRLDRAQNNKADAAWITGAVPVGPRASIADNRGGNATTLYLTSTGEQEAKVKVTASAGSGGGTPATKEVSIPPGATVALPAPEPAGLNGAFALTVETVSGGPVTAARMLTVAVKDVPGFTVQAFRDDHSTVRIPQSQPNPAVLLH